MSILLLLALIFSIWAWVRSGRAERRGDELLRRLDALETELRASRAAVLKGVGQVPSDSASAPGSSGWQSKTAFPKFPAERAGPVNAAPSFAATLSKLQPSQAPPLAPARPRGPSIWEPQFSRARISIIGGFLVLGGLAFTLQAVGAPAWTLLVAVFAFGALLYFNARRVPWPVSGALRGLGYGVVALGLGSLTARLPSAWGPACVLLGLLGLSAALLGDALRRREPLLGALAVAGAALSTWMLTDDLGVWSIPASGLVLLLAAAAVWWNRPKRQKENREEHLSQDQSLTQSAALAMLLGIAGSVPVGWLVASISHLPQRWENLDQAEWVSSSATVFKLSGSAALWPWLIFSVLALMLPLALLRRQAEPDTLNAAGEPEELPSTSAVVLAAAWSTVLPQALVAAAIGSALHLSSLKVSGLSVPSLPNLLLALLSLLPVVLIARSAWRTTVHRAVASNADELLPGTLASALTAAATSLAAAVLISLLGERSQPLAFAALASTLLVVGLSGRSRLWLRVGAAGLASTSLWSAGSQSTDADWIFSSWPLWVSGEALRLALLAAAPAALSLLAAWRIGRNVWASQPQVQEVKWVPASIPDSNPSAANPGSPNPSPADPPRPRQTATLLAGLGSALISWNLIGAGLWVLWVWCLLAALALFWPAVRRRLTSQNERSGQSTSQQTVFWWAFAPASVLGALMLLGGSVGPLPTVLAVSALWAAGAALFFKRQPGSDVGGLALLALSGYAVIRSQGLWLGGWPALGPSGVLALLGVLTAPLRLTLTWRRTSVLLSLAALAALLWSLAIWFGGGNEPPVLGATLLLLAWWLTRTTRGLHVLSRLTAPWHGLPPSAVPSSAANQVLWLAALLNLATFTLGLRISGDSSSGSAGWLTLGSVLALALGFETCRHASQASDRRSWSVGLSLMIAAGLKSVLIDAIFFGNVAAAIGIAVLISGLSLLAVAIVAPRPALDAQ